MLKSPEAFASPLFEIQEPCGSSPRFILSFPMDVKLIF
jgi:hypothetical protein